MVWTPLYLREGGILHLPVLFSYVHVIFSGLLKSSAPSRLINVSSFMHAYGQLDVQNLDFYKICRPFEAFYNSHLGIVMATRELYRTLKQTGEAPYEISLFLYSDFFFSVPQNASETGDYHDKTYIMIYYLL